MKAAATRRLLVNTAADLFVARGYDAASMNDVAVAAGLTKGAVYGHFRSKGQLLVEVIRGKLADFDQAHVAGAEQGVDSATGLALDQRGRAVRLLEVDAAAAARHDADVAAGLRDLYATRYRAIEDALTDRVEDPKTVAWLLGALAVGIGTREAIGIRPPGAQRVAAVLRLLSSAAG
jgi:AcrR family transcriptional regulator